MNAVYVTSFSFKDEQPDLRNMSHVIKISDCLSISSLKNEKINCKQFKGAFMIPKKKKQGHLLPLIAVSLQKKPQSCPIACHLIHLPTVTSSRNKIFYILLSTGLLLFRHLLPNHGQILYFFFLIFNFFKNG